MVHGFGAGIFFDIIKHHDIPFHIYAVLDITPQDHNHMQIFSNIQHISSNIDQFLSYIHASLSLNIQYYYFAIYELQSKAGSQRYFKYQLEIMSCLQANHKLMIIALQLHYSIGRSITDKIQLDLTPNQWVMSKHCFNFTEFGDSIDG